MEHFWDLIFRLMKCGTNTLHVVFYIFVQYIKVHFGIWDCSMVIEIIDLIGAEEDGCAREDVSENVADVHWEEPCRPRQQEQIGEKPD